MSKSYKKKSDTTLEISEDVTKVKEISLDALFNNKVSLQKAIDATQQSLDTLNTQMVTIDDYVKEARKLGIKTQKEIDDNI